MSFDPFVWARPPRVTITVELNLNGEEVPITLVAMDLLDRQRAISLRDRMIEKYVPFAERRDEDLTLPPIEFPPIGGLPVIISEETCEACAMIAVMQSPLVFGFEQLVALAATRPPAFERLLQAAKAHAAQDDSGKEGMTSPAASSAPA